MRTPFISILFAVAAAASAETSLAQSCGSVTGSPNTSGNTSQALTGITLDQTSTSDNLQVLLASSAERGRIDGTTTGMAVDNPGENRKYSYVGGFNSTQDYLAWSINVPAAAQYRIQALLDAGDGEQFTLTASGGATTVTATFTASGGGWNKYPVDASAALDLPAGAVCLTIAHTSGSSAGRDSIRSLELIRASDVAAYNQRIADFKLGPTPKADWFRNAGYGLMFQYGSWGLPNNANTAKALDRTAADFPVDQFVQMVKNTGAKYVIWSMSWWGYRMEAPLSAANTIVSTTAPAAGADVPAAPGVPGTATSLATQSYDLIGAVASKLQAQGIRFILYYHTGSEEKYLWWPWQGLPDSNQSSPTRSSFSSFGIRDSATFVSNWKKVITEIGNRYGTNLDGFFFDDGMIYYPSPFESMGAAARAGNPNRLISWNAYILPRVTEFQDMDMGENSRGQATNPVSIDANSIELQGPGTGLIQHGMSVMDNDWGVNNGNSTGQQSRSGSNVISAGGVASSDAIAWGLTAQQKKVPISFDLMMYEDGTLPDADLRTFSDLRQAVYPGTVEPLPSGVTMVDDTDAALTFTGSWTAITGRLASSGDYGNDIHNTAVAGDKVDFSFTGTGADILGALTATPVSFAVSVDGTQITPSDQPYARAAANAASYAAQQVLYSARHLDPGPHTVTLTLVSGTLNIDAVRKLAMPAQLNDTDPAFAYTGGWSYAGQRGLGDFNDDIHQSSTSGDAVTIAFSGTGIDVNAPISSGCASCIADVVLDGVKVSTLNGANAGALALASSQAQQHMWGVRNLSPGPHTLKLVNTQADSASSLQIDSVLVWDPPAVTIAKTQASPAGNMAPAGGEVAYALTAANATPTAAGSYAFFDEIADGASATFPSALSGATSPDCTGTVTGPAVCTIVLASVPAGSIDAGTNTLVPGRASATLKVRLSAGLAAGTTVVAAATDFIPQPVPTCPQINYVVACTVPPGNTDTFNAGNPAIGYSGDGWAAGAVTQNDGDSASLSFTGIGISLQVDTCGGSSDNCYGYTLGKIDVYIDGVLDTTVDTNTGDPAAGVQLAFVYSKTWPNNGAHTIKIVKNGGDIIVFNAFVVTRSNTPTPPYALPDNCSVATADASVQGYTCTTVPPACPESFQHCVTTTVVAASNTVTAVVAAGSGKILPASQDVAFNGTATFDITPDPGSGVLSVAGDTCTPTKGNGTQWTAAYIQSPCKVTASFTALPVDGVCGADNGKTLAAPPQNLCSAGTASAVSGSGPWNWTCGGANGGSSAACSANAVAARLQVGNGAIHNGDTQPNTANGTDLGSVVVGASAAHDFQLANVGGTMAMSGAIRSSSMPPGTMPAAVGDLRISGISSSNPAFTVSGGSGLLPLGAGATFNVRFDARAPGSQAATITITSNDPASPIFTFVVAANAIVASKPVPAPLLDGWVMSLLSVALAGLALAMLQRRRRKLGDA